MERTNAFTLEGLVPVSSRTPCLVIHEATCPMPQASRLLSSFTMTAEVTSAARKPKDSLTWWLTQHSWGNTARVSRGLCAVFETVFEIHARYTLIQIYRSSTFFWCSSFSFSQSVHKLLPKFTLPHSNCPTSWYTLHRARVRVLTDTWSNIMNAHAKMCP
jgi:hypothetical protein